MKTEVTKEEIHEFLNGRDPQERIIKIEGNYQDDKISVIYYDTNNIKKVKHVPFYPFCWAKQSAGPGLFNGNRALLKSKLREYNISCKGLRVSNSEGITPERMERGYRVLFKAETAMSFHKFLQFFKEGGRPIYPNQGDSNYGIREYITVSPVEQFMIQTGKRQFKGYEDYDELLRLQFDLETEGLDPQKNCISQIGIRTNKGFEQIIPVTGEGEEKFTNETKALAQFFEIIRQIKPDIISGHNIENFDFWFIDERLKLRGSSLEKFTEYTFPHGGIYKANKQKVLKLGGEMEYYTPTIMWGTTITDSLFAVRRAQALNSNIKKADLKYITKFSKLNKPNRVYVPGKIINSTWVDEKKRYAHNDENGHWFKITRDLLQKNFIDDNNIETKRYELLENNTKLYDVKENEKFNIVSGRYIVERYLLDDLYETDKVENMYNQSNFLVSKMIPVSYDKVCTMGTAAIWKYIMLAWSYENNLAIPEITEKVNFVGGLSRLLSVGFVQRVVKLDYNSLYPSIELTFGIENEVDIMGVLLVMLEYILSMREHYKGLKAKYGEQIDEIEAMIKSVVDSATLSKYKDEIPKLKKLKTSADTLQLPLKILGNSYFGGSSSGSPFPWTDTLCRGPEQTTCTGRQMLRLMIYHFSHISSFNNQNLSDDYNYKPIVGDSFTGDTPLFIKDNKTELIDIKPISELINEEYLNKDILGREYDYSKKDYKVLCRSGWVEPSYIYRHKTEKPIYRVKENDMVVDITEDHSLFNSKQEKIKPSEINKNTELEYYNKQLRTISYNITDKNNLEKYAKVVARVGLKIPRRIINANKETRNVFLNYLNKYLTKEVNIRNFSKTFVAGYNFIRQ